MDASRRTVSEQCHYPQAKRLLCQNVLPKISGRSNVSAVLAPEPDKDRRPRLRPRFGGGGLHGERMACGSMASAWSAAPWRAHGVRVAPAALRFHLAEQGKQEAVAAAAAVLCPQL
eukprot:365990-Chlamydomonas_euryale.AAC.2